VLPPIAGIKEVVHAAEWLARRGWGALIVVEREQEVMPHVQGGVVLDAHVSAPLLRSLFHPGGALHDGAVVIRNGRVHAAGCLLPLAEQSVESHGVRHRAALGLSQRTDALVLVVSEETGELSLVLNGQLFPGLLTGELRRWLARCRDEANCLSSGGNGIISSEQTET